MAANDYYGFIEIIPTEFRAVVIIFLTMSMVRYVSKILLEVVDLGYVPPEMGAPKLNLDKFGMPQDYASYMWVLYKKIVNDESPNRRAFLGLDSTGFKHPDLGLQYVEA